MSSLSQEDESVVSLPQSKELDLSKLDEVILKETENIEALPFSAYIAVSDAIRSVEERLSKLEKKAGVYSPPSSLPSPIRIKRGGWSSLRSRIREDRDRSLGRKIDMEIK